MHTFIIAGRTIVAENIYRAERIADQYYAPAPAIVLVGLRKSTIRTMVADGSPIVVTGRQVN